MLLHTLLEQYLLENVVGDNTAGQYRRSLNSFGVHLGRPPTLDDLNSDAVNRWLIWLEQDYAPISVKGKKAGVTVVWNYAAGLGMVDPYHPRRIRQIRVPRKPVTAWTDDDVRILLEAAAEVPGRLRSGLKAAPLIESYARVNFETGLRQNDLIDLQRSQFDDRGVLRITQKKTKMPHVCRVSLETLEMIDATGAKHREQIWPLTKDGWNYWLRKLLAAANKKRGLSTLRKSHATAVCRAQGIEAAAASLGHVSGSDVARRWYIGETEEAPEPPKILKGAS